MRRAYFVLSLGIIALGLIHIAATPRLFAHFNSAAVWFASGGLVIILTGALNLLRRAYGEIARGLKLVCVANNVVMTGFAVLSGYATKGSVIQFVVVLTLFGAATLCSLMANAQIASRSTARSDAQ